MNEQEDFLSPNHHRLLNIAWWAKNIAWVMLIIYVLLVGAKIVEFQNLENYRADVTNQARQDLTELLIENPLKAFELGVDMVTVILKGIIYYLVLKGISIGLNMIVETDINYREQKREEVAQ